MAKRYPRGLGLTDKVGARFSLVWGREWSRESAGELKAEIAVNDGYDAHWSFVALDRDQLIELAAHILGGLSPTGETIDRIISGLETA